MNLANFEKAVVYLHMMHYSVSRDHCEDGWGLREQTRGGLRKESGPLTHLLLPVLLVLVTIIIILAGQWSPLLHRPVAVQGALSAVGGGGLSELGRGAPHSDAVVIRGGDQDLKISSSDK